MVPNFWPLPHILKTVYSPETASETNYVAEVEGVCYHQQLKFLWVCMTMFTPAAKGFTISLP